MGPVVVLFAERPSTRALLEAARAAGLDAREDAHGSVRVAGPLADGNEASPRDVVVELFSRPADDAALAEAALHSRWPGAADAVARHRAHARLVATHPLGRGPDRPLDHLLALSSVAAAVLAMPGATALFDEAGRVLADPVEAARRLADPTTPPLELWVGVRTFDVADASGCFLDTLGMARLGLPDLEAYAADGDSAIAVAAWLRNVGLHLVQSDAATRLRDGDTLDGPDELPWVTVEDVATVEPPRPVLRFTPLPAQRS